MTRRPRSVSFSETVEKSKSPILDKSSYSDYLDCWYTSRDHKGFKRSVRDLVELLEANPSLENSRTRSTIFRGIERHTITEKVRIREKREISYSIVESLQGRSDFQMAKMLRSQSDDCLLEAHKRALEDEKLYRDAQSKLEASHNNTAKDTASSRTTPRTKPPRTCLPSRTKIVRSF
ncbi:unnamed protein product [Cylindrotheca closterium]|uniref:Uncharacterized protein n=1 Tax=Cylindrotheca closterium TaxID=2856 RepID=A0AAD2FTJ1_9STRA|nr:unnamed protein product [Cylindrotheca closterium]